MRWSRVLDTAWNAGQRGLVQDAINTTADAGYGVGISKIDSKQINFGRNGCEVFAAAGGEVVEAANVVPASDECLRKMRTDEARDAGNEIGCQAIKFSALVRLRMCGPRASVILLELMEKLVPGPLASGMKVMGIFSRCPQMLTSQLSCQGPC